MILAGDVGGTSTRLALFEVVAGRLVARAGQTYPSREHAGLGDIVAAFTAQHAVAVAQASFGVAGPVRRGRAQAINLPWVTDAAELARELGLPRVGLINDVEANAWGVAAIEPHDVVTLNAGAPDAEGNMAIISAGTGLGEAGFHWDGARHRPFATEGGHADFAPRDALEADLLHYLRGRFGRVSYERVLSGPGLRNIYEFLRDTGRAPESAAVAEAMTARDPSAVISEAARAGSCPLSVQALGCFVSLYGAEAGNLGLKMLATGGVWVGGGIAPRIIDTLRGPAFMASFTAKGRLGPLMQAIPVRVILNDQTALMGAARHAAVEAGLL